MKRLVESTEQSDSIEITRGQRGEFGWTVKVYADLTDADSQGATRGALQNAVDLVRQAIAYARQKEVEHEPRA